MSLIDSYNRFDTIPALDGRTNRQTDRQTDGISYRAADARCMQDKVAARVRAV